MKKISLDEKFALFDEHWRPKIIAALNGQEVKIVKVKGEFPWHHHANEDEFFMVWKGYAQYRQYPRCGVYGADGCYDLGRRLHIRVGNVCCWGESGYHGGPRL
jgi:hypothetical protein